MGSGRGSTFYVGSRLSGKVCRVYEKGKQLGDRASRWVRAELELHAKDRVIPWDMVVNPVSYLAGSYKFFARLSLFPAGVSTFKAAREVTVETVRRWVKAAAGRSLNLLLDIEGGDLGAVVMSVIRPGFPGRWRSFADAPCA